MKPRLKGNRGLEAKWGLGIATKRSLGIAVAVVTLLVMDFTPVLAGSLDPPLFIGNTTQCANSSCTGLGAGTVVGDEGIGIAANTLTIYDQGAASSTVQSPLLRCSRRKHHLRPAWNQHCFDLGIGKLDRFSGRF